MKKITTDTGYYIHQVDPIWLGRAMVLHKPARLTAVCISWHCSIYEISLEDGWRMLQTWIPRQVGATSKEIGLGLRQLAAAGLVELKRRGERRKPYWRIKQVTDFKFVEPTSTEAALGGSTDEMDQRLQALNTATRRKQLRSEEFRESRRMDVYEKRRAKGKIVRRPKS